MYAKYSVVNDHLHFSSPSFFKIWDNFKELASFFLAKAKCMSLSDGLCRRNILGLLKVELLKKVLRIILNIYLLQCMQIHCTQITCKGCAVYFCCTSNKHVE